MKGIKNLLVAVALTSSLTATAQNPQKYVGGDISLLPTYEEKGVRYLDSDGHQVQPLEYFGRQGWNAMRVRLFVDPSKASPAEQDEGVRQDLDYMTRLSKRIKESGYALMLDFHYSDTWTDPGKHATPSAWQSDDPTVLADSVRAYTVRCLNHLKANGVTPDFIQPGNEITYGMLWPTGRCYPDGNNYGSGTFANLVSYLKAGVEGCKEVCPEAKIVIQTELSKSANVVNFYNTLSSQVDYDIIGLSYYPDWHGPLATLRSTLNTLESQHGDKEIMIVETGYGSQWPVGSTYTASQLGWTLTEEGQKQFADDLVEELNKHSRVTGLFWWMPEDNEFWAENNPARSTWWNASLYRQNTGKPLPALFELQKFLENSTTSIATSMANGCTKNERWHTLHGERIHRPTQRGIYVHGNRKEIVR